MKEARLVSGTSSPTLTAILVLTAAAALPAQEPRWPALERYQPMAVPLDNPMTEPKVEPARISATEKRQLLDFLRELDVDFVDPPPRLPEENESPMSLEISRISQIALVVHDVAKAEDFYKNTLGLKHLFSVPSKLAFFDAGGTRLMLSVPEPGIDFKSAIVYFDVADIQAAHQELLAKGTPGLGAPHVVGKLGDKEVWIAEFKDPDGNHLALQSIR